MGSIHFPAQIFTTCGAVLRAPVGQVMMQVIEQEYRAEVSAPCRRFGRPLSSRHRGAADKSLLAYGHSHQSVKHLAVMAGCRPTSERILL
jgi:hypothetical protein